MKMPSEAVRGYAYRVLVAAGLVAVFYGLLTEQELAVWLGLAATVFNITPAVNTSVKR